MFTSTQGQTSADICKCGRYAWIKGKFNEACIMKYYKSDGLHCERCQNKDAEVEAGYIAQIGKGLYFSLYINVTQKL